MTGSGSETVMRHTLDKSRKISYNNKKEIAPSRKAGGIMTKIHDPTDVRNLHSRLNKLIGQMHAIDRMIDEGISSEDLIIQVNSIKSAMHSFGRAVLEKELAEALQSCAAGADPDAAFEKYRSVLGRFADLSK